MLRSRAPCLRPPCTSWCRRVATVHTINPTAPIPPGSTIFSGIQPTGQFHLGNYFGAVRNWRDLQQSRDCALYFFTADLHSLTVPQNYQHLNDQRIQAYASILACGIDPERAIVYHQSQVPEIAKLTWILSCFTSMGMLNRMTQWKSKASLKQESDLGKVKLGLFSYPVLMAADILSVNATHVPVGLDQSQHLELTREIAQAFNRAVGTDFFNLPNTLLTQTKKIVSLKDPLKKMSKSDRDPLSKVFITDSEADIRLKFKKAVTDSIDGPLTIENRPAIANLITILAACRGATVEETARDCAPLSKGDLKAAVADAVVAELSEPRRLYLDLMADPTRLERIAAQGAAKARAQVDATCKQVSMLVGMGY